METQPVNSSSIKRIGHCPMANALEVHHASGQVWRYEGVSEAKYQQLMAAPSIGAHFNQHIKDRHPGKKI